jgi:aarF domain-containing kinase
MGYRYPRLIMVDTGLITTLSPNDRENFLDLFMAIAEGRGDQVAQLLVDRAPPSLIQRYERIFHHAITTSPQFNMAISAFIGDIHRRTLQLGQFTLSSILVMAMGTVRVYRVPLDPSYTNLAVSLIIMEGLGRSLDPHLDVLAVSRHYLHGRLYRRGNGSSMNVKEMVSRGSEWWLSRGGLGLKWMGVVEWRWWVGRMGEWDVVDALGWN